MADDRTVLHALPEDQPDSLGKGSKSNSIHGKSSSGFGKPTSSDSKADWVDYAVSQGADRADAESSTKSELVESYG